MFRHPSPAPVTKSAVEQAVELHNKIKEQQAELNKVYAELTDSEKKDYQATIQPRLLQHPGCTGY